MKKVLFFEDDKIYSEKITSVVNSSHGFVIDCVSNLRNFGKKVSNEYDLCIIDYDLQETSGDRVIKTLNDIYPQLSVTLISHRKVLNDYSKHDFENFVKFIVKPDRHLQLVEEVKDILQEIDEDQKGKLPGYDEVLDDFVDVK